MDFSVPTSVWLVVSSELQVTSLLINRLAVFAQPTLELPETSLRHDQSRLANTLDENRPMPRFATLSDSISDYGHDRVNASRFER